MWIFPFQNVSYHKKRRQVAKMISSKGIYKWIWISIFTFAVAIAYQDFFFIYEHLKKKKKKKKKKNYFSSCNAMCNTLNSTIFFNGYMCKIFYI